MSLDTCRRAMVTKGLLVHATAPDTDDTLLSVEQRDEAMRQYRIEAASQLPLKDLLEIVTRRYKTDRQFRAGVRSIDSRKPDNPGRLGKLSDGQLYEIVQLQRLSVGKLTKAIEIVAKHFDMKPETATRKYEREVSRIKKARAAKQTDK